MNLYHKILLFNILIITTIMFCFLNTIQGATVYNKANPLMNNKTFTYLSCVHFHTKDITITHVNIIVGYRDRESSAFNNTCEIINMYRPTLLNT